MAATVVIFYKLGISERLRPSGDGYYLYYTVREVEGGEEAADGGGVAGVFAFVFAEFTCEAVEGP